MRRWLRSPELLQQIGPYAAGIQERFELDRCELPNLFFGVVHPALVADAGTNLLHDLLDVDRVGADVEVGHSNLSAFRLSAGSLGLTAESYTPLRVQRADRR